MTNLPFTVTVYDRTASANVFQETVDLYSEVYAEPPYLESDQDFAAFADDLPLRANQDSFRLVVARIGQTPVGFALGHQLPPGTRWWAGATTYLSDEVTREHPGRTFAIIELAVSRLYRRSKIGRLLHSLLLADLIEERIALLVRPDATPAKAAYGNWGYESVGQVRPLPSGPIYDTMLLERRKS